MFQMEHSGLAFLITTVHVRIWKLKPMLFLMVYICIETLGYGILLLKLTRKSWSNGCKEVPVLWLWEYWDKIMKLIWPPNAQVHHVFREAIMVVGFLAKKTSDGYSNDSFYGDEITTLLREIMRIDCWELPYLRC